MRLDAAPEKDDDEDGGREGLELVPVRVRVRG